MSLRDRKQNYVNLVRLYHRQGQLTNEEATGFEALFRKCRSPGEQHQVWTALTSNVTRLSVDNDFYARLHRDDLLEVD
jgi:hypothetical protein